MFRIAMTLFLAAHGFAHLAGFAAAWGFINQAPRPATLFDGRLDVGAGGMRLVGVLWLIVGAAFFVVAAGLFQHTSWWRPALVAAIAASLALGLAQWPLANIGVWIDVGLLALFALVLWLRLAP